MTNEAIYEKCTLNEYAKNPHGTRMDVVYAAMSAARQDERENLKPK